MSATNCGEGFIEPYLTFGVAADFNLIHDNRLRFSGFMILAGYFMNQHVVFSPLASHYRLYAGAYRSGK